MSAKWTLVSSDDGKGWFARFDPGFALARGVPNLFWTRDVLASRGRRTPDIAQATEELPTRNPAKTASLAAPPAVGFAGR